MNGFSSSEIKRILRELADKNGGVLDERQVVEHAKDEQSPLHSHFEWDDGIAAESYRLAQAAQLIRRVKYNIVRPSTDSREVDYTITKAAAFPSLASQRRTGEGSRNPLDVIMNDPVKRRDLLNTALGELQALQRKYANLVELDVVWDAIAKVVDETTRENGPTR